MLFHNSVSDRLYTEKALKIEAFGPAKPVMKRLLVASLDGDQLGLCDHLAPHTLELVQPFQTEELYVALPRKLLDDSCWG
jgi:hypothetical protein